MFEDRSVNFSLGEGSEVGVVEGVEIALEKFKTGEKSRLKLKPQHAFGEAGKAEFKIPSNAVVEYEVELKSFEKVCFLCLQTDFTIIFGSLLLYDSIVLC